MPNLIWFNQNAYVPNRFISKGGRLISNILETFGSNKHYFLLAFLAKYGLKKNSVRRKTPKSCIIIGGNYISLIQIIERNMLSWFLLWIFIYSSIRRCVLQKKILKTFNHESLYTTYADDTTFFKIRIQFLKSCKLSIKFSLISGLKPKTTKCKLTAIGTLKGVNEALYGMKYLNLMKKTLKILGAYF